MTSKTRTVIVGSLAAAVLLLAFLISTKRINPYNVMTEEIKNRGFRSGKTQVRRHSLLMLFSMAPAAQWCKEFEESLVLFSLW